MKRKIIQLAEKTLVISLPSKWVREWDIKKGDELEAETKGAVIMYLTETEKEHKKITINTENSSERVIRWWLSSLHKKGYDEIEIFYKKEQLPLIKEINQDLMTGFAITERTDQRCVLQAITQEDEKNFDKVLRRAFQVTLTMGDSLAEAIKEDNKEELEEIKRLEKTNNQLTNFCQRIINKRGLKEPATNSFYYIIAWNMEKIADEYKYISEHILADNIKISKETIDFLKETNSLLREYYEFFYDKNIEKINKANQKRKKLQEKIIKNIEKGKETIIISRILGMVEKTADFSASMIAIHTEKQD